MHMSAKPGTDFINVSVVIHAYKSEQTICTDTLPASLCVTAVVSSAWHGQTVGVLWLGRWVSWPRCVMLWVALCHSLSYCLSFSVCLYMGIFQKMSKFLSTNFENIWVRQEKILDGVFFLTALSPPWSQLLKTGDLNENYFRCFPFIGCWLLLGSPKTVVQMGGGGGGGGYVIAITGIKRKLLDKIYCDCTAVYLLVRALDKQRHLAQKKNYCSVCYFFSYKIFVSLDFRLFVSLQWQKCAQHKIIIAPCTKNHPRIRHIGYFHGKRDENSTVSSFWSRNFRCVENACGHVRCIITITLLFTTDRLHNIVEFCIWKGLRITLLFSKCRDLNFWKGVIIISESSMLSSQ